MQRPFLRVTIIAGLHVGRIFCNFLVSNNLAKLINEPTHIRDDGTQTCIGLICTDQPYIFYRYRGLTNS